ncbi:MAG: ParB/RepB/Spo0J family partition protein [Brevinematales bacterium]|nr:ParB/RepB/Spo0J family partition protein [Brevinematales bacterium]
MIDKKKRLGKGMMALVDEMSDSQPDAKDIGVIDIDRIIPNRYQPRKTISEGALKELADSIREKGVIQPVIVSELGDGRYELVAGERRWRASKLAGLLEIPAIIRDYSEEERIEIALIENIQREDLNAMEVAMAYKEIMERIGLTQEQLSQKIGKNRSTVTNTLRLLKLPEYIRDRVMNGELTEGHARAILSVEDIDGQLNLAKTIIERGLSVREAEEIARGGQPKKKPDVSRETSKARDTGIDELQERFISALGAKVELVGSKKKGKIMIYYHNTDELETLFRAIVRGK